MLRLARLVASLLSVIGAILAVVLLGDLALGLGGASPEGAFLALAIIALPVWLFVFAPAAVLLGGDDLVFRMSRLPFIGLLLGAGVALLLLGPFAFTIPHAVAGPAVGFLAGFTFAAVNHLLQRDLGDPLEAPAPEPLPGYEGPATPYLTVLYDRGCGLCYRARRWLEGQDLYVPLRFVGTNSGAARRAFPTLDHELSQRDVTVIGPEGQVWRGAEAWLMCMWATWSFRGLSQDLATPAGMQRVRQLIDTLSGQRHRISAALRLEPERACADGGCERSAPPPAGGARGGERASALFDAVIPERRARP